MHTKSDYKYSCLNFKTAIERAYNFIRTTIANCECEFDSSEINRRSSWSSSLYYRAELNWTEPNPCAVLMDGYLTALPLPLSLCTHEAANYYSDTFSAYSDKRMHTHCVSAVLQHKENWKCFRLTLPLSLTLSVCCLYSPFEHPFMHAVLFNATNDLPPLTRYRSSLADPRAPPPPSMLSSLLLTFLQICHLLLIIFIPRKWYC